MFDASEEVYHHILCCICPVKLSEPGLSYNEATNLIEERPRDWWVQPPMFDASEEVYHHILCCICPVKLSEPGLSYNEATNLIEERPRDWWVQPPMTGFLFPAFNDRSSDIHSLLYFSKKKNGPGTGGCSRP